MEYVIEILWKFPRDDFVLAMIPVTGSYVQLMACDPQRIELNRSLMFSHELSLRYFLVD